MLAAVLLSLVAVPIVGSLASDVYSRELAVSREQIASRHSVTAVLLTDTPPGVASEAGSGADDTEPALARWRLLDGSERLGTVSADPGTSAGSTVTIWLDPAGNPTSAPMTAAAAAGIALALGVLFWVGAVAALVLVLVVVRIVLDRVRAAEWAREWERLGRDSSRS